MRGLAGCAALLLAAAGLAAPATATSIATMRPHDPARARSAIDHFFGLVDRSEAAAIGENFYPQIYADSFGRIEGPEELRAFLAERNSAEGHPDSAPMRVYRIRRIFDDEFWPVYVALVERTRWISERLDEMSGEIEPAGYSTLLEAWLIQFQSNRIVVVREAGELLQFGFEPSEPDDDDR